MIKKVFKTTVIVIVMALMSATSFADNNAQNGSDSNWGYFEIYAYFPEPIGVQYIPVYAFATVTWHLSDGSSSAPDTKPGTSIGTYAWRFDFPWVDNAEYVTYKVWGTNGSVTVKQTCGTFVINAGNPLTIDSSPASWNNCEKNAWDDPYDPGSTD